MKPTINLRLSQEVIAELRRLHPGYGEAQRLARQLVEAYVTARRASSRPVDAIAGAVLEVIR